MNVKFWQSQDTVKPDTSEGQVEKSIKFQNSLPLMSFSIRAFGPFYRTHFLSSRFERDLQRSRIPFTREEFFSYTTLITASVAIVALVISIPIALGHPRFSFLIISLAVFSIVLFFALMLEIPNARVSTRKKDIDAKLPTAIAFMSAMASANISIDNIFYDLGNSPEYGEISSDARSVSVSSKLFGKDIITAIKEAAKASPSIRFSEFLLGIVTTLTSGGDLKEYLKSKVKQYSTELNTDVKRNNESLGIMAESYITVGVAFPLVLLIIVGVIAALSPSSPGPLILVLYLTVGVIIPVISAVFALFIRSTVKEVDL